MQIGEREQQGVAAKFWDKPLIDSCRMWKEETYRVLSEDKVDNIMYDERGNVYCVSPITGKIRQMVPLRMRMTVRHKTTDVLPVLMVLNALEGRHVQREVFLWPCGEGADKDL